MEWEERLVSAVNSYISSGQNDTMSTCVEQLETGRVKLVDFVSILRDALTSNVVAERRRGIQLLTEVITALPQTFCSDAEVTLLMEFFCARLSDHHSVVPLCFAGIAKLLHCGTLGSKDIIYVVRAVFSDVIVQTLVQSDRMLIYEMFQHLLSDRLSDLRGITAEFICGFVQAIDSEKEPRNLLMCLSLVEIVAKEFKLDGTLAEQLFEIVACYYPIDFSPPAGAMSTVTKEQLSTALMNAMTASPLFGSFCLPLLLEKLSSNVTSAKMDSLQMLVHCCNIFRQKDIDEHSVELWNCIKSDVFAQHSVIQDEALYALTTLVKCLSNGMDNYESRSKQCNKFVTVILGDCGKYLYDAEQVACKQAGKLLSATCQGSSEACHMVMQFAMPVIVTEFHRHTGTQSLARQNLLDVLKALLVAANNVSINSNNLSPVTDYKESVTDIYVSLLISTDPALRCHAASGIARLVVLPFLLKTHESNLLMQHLLNILLSDSEPSVIQESVANATLVALKQPGVICHIFLPVLTRILNGSKDDIELGQHVDAVFIVQLLSTISVHSVVTIETIPILFSYISSLTQNSDCALNEFHQCCVCLTSIVTVMSSDCSEYFVNWLAPKCVALTLHICTTSQSTLHAHQLVTELAVVVHNVVQRETETNLSTFVLSLLSTFLHGDKVKYHEHTDLAIADFIPLGVNFPGEQVCSLALLTAVVCSSCNLIELSLLDELMTLLVDLILQSADEVVHVCACKCLSGLVNRRPQNAFLDAKLQTLQSAIEAEIYAKEVSKLSKKKAMTLCIWITKSLVMRNHAKQMVFLKFLMDTLADSELASSAADGFKFVLSDDNELTDAVFSSASGATRTTMYKQRFFTMSLPLLLADYQNASSEMKRSYVMALLQLMQFVPQQVLIPEIPQLLPVLLQSLNSEEPLTWLITLDTLTELISDNSEVFQSYVDDLVPRVLALSAYSPMMKVRIAAVRCISEFSVMPVHLLLPHQHKVLQQLSSTIDDHKRLVRQEAAVARSRWFLIGSSDK